MKLLYAMMGFAAVSCLLMVCLANDAENDARIICFYRCLATSITCWKRCTNDPLGNCRNVCVKYRTGCIYRCMFPKVSPTERSL
ncbi:hypothetical protein LSAT2_009796 [Lamellibrachia satsuma]|nr:hypothetical protein LSAT2_009796 [Lamellibrachia satsuma]